MKKFNDIRLYGALLAMTSGVAQAALITETEDFSGNAFNNSAFEATGPYMLSGEQLFVLDRFVYRTTDEYVATQVDPIFFNFTMTFLGGNIAFASMRSSDDPYDANHEPADGLILRMHSIPERSYWCG